jgi:hypothetical protein
MDNLHDILKNSNSISDIAKAIFGKENISVSPKIRNLFV